MHAYTPVSLEHVWVVLSLCVFTLVMGRWLSQSNMLTGARLLAWFTVLFDFVFLDFYLINDPAGFRMLAICLVVLWAMKGVVAVESRITEGTRLGFVSWLSWSAGWPGMRIGIFSELGSGAKADAWHLITKGIIRLAMGGGLLWLGRWSWDMTQSKVLATVFILPGLSLILHFGLFNICAGFWRLLGADTYTLFPAPLLSTRLSEFWGKRWNLPFTEMVQYAIYRPLSSRFGKSVAALSGFFFSGLLHEMAISVPAGAGYGLPMLYFVLHGGLVYIERKVFTPESIVFQKPWLGRVWTLVWLALPMPILFHPPFLKGVVWPIVGIPG